MDFSDSSSFNQTESSFLNLIQQFEHDAKQLGILSPNKHIITPTVQDRKISSRIQLESKSYGRQLNLDGVNPSIDHGSNLNNNNKYISFNPLNIIQKTQNNDLDTFSESTTDFNDLEGAKKRLDVAHNDWLDVSAISNITNGTQISNATDKNDFQKQTKDQFINRETIFNSNRSASNLNSNLNSNINSNPNSIPVPIPSGGGANLTKLRNQFLNNENEYIKQGRHSIGDVSELKTSTIIEREEIRRNSFGEINKQRMESLKIAGLDEIQSEKSSLKSKTPIAESKIQEQIIDVRKSPNFSLTLRQSPRLNEETNKLNLIGNDFFSVKDEELSSLSIETQKKNSIIIRSDPVKGRKVMLFSPSRNSPTPKKIQQSTQKSQSNEPIGKVLSFDFQTKDIELNRNPLSVNSENLPSSNINSTNETKSDLALTINKFKSPVSLLPSTSLIRSASHTKTDASINNETNNDSMVLEMRNSNLEKMIQNLNFDIQQKEKISIHYEKAFENEKDLNSKLNQQLGESVEKIASLSQQLTELRIQKEESVDELKLKIIKLQSELNQAKNISDLENNNIIQENKLLTKEVSDLREQIRENQIKLTDYEFEISQQLPQIQSLKEENAHFQSLHQKQNEHANHLANKLAEAQDNLLEIQNQKQILDSTLQEIKHSIHSESNVYKEKFTQIQSIVQELQNSKKHLERENSKLLSNQEELKQIYNEKISRLKTSEEQIQSTLEEVQKVNKKLILKNDNLKKQIESLQESDNVSVSKQKVDIWRKTRTIQEQRLQDLQLELKSKQILEDEMRQEILSLNEENQALRKSLLEIDNRYTDQQQSLLNHSHTNLQSIQVRYSHFIKKYEDLVSKYKLIKQKNKKYKGKYISLKQEFTNVKKEQQRLRTQIDILMEKEV